MIKNFVAFDFETANGKNPCSIGIVEFEDGNVVNEYYSLIKPKELYFNPFTTNVHGISIEDIINEREFPEIWNEIKHFFNNKIVVAHNHSFDVSVLNHSLEIYNIEQPAYDIHCTLSLSRSYLKIENHKLSTIAKYFKVNQKKYHNALDDAYVCGRVFINLMEFANSNKKSETVYLKQKVRNSWQQIEKVTRNPLFEKSILELRSDKLRNKKIVITGVFKHFERNDLKKSIEDNGGKVSSSISKNTSYLIAGENMGPAKKVKAESLNVSIISENDYLELLE
ncbi:3'-5' exonuclease [Lutibacter sp.]|uniref:3'-5' exonuclease n=1 Tax=Lutibacter sp. TaxID=1925666 RepID=UPI0027343EA6|nr:exonuclease domain-containing protein [Lutibacter sp.]MDP3312002.1 exonuclease domain-containing protein [Lutibacter sp.]